MLIPSSFDFPDSKETTIYLLDKEGASQSFIVMGHLADKYDVDGDHFKSQIMNYPLGGGMSGRFFLNLREEKGWTYGANSMFMACLLYTSPSPRDATLSRMPSSA